MSDFVIPEETLRQQATKDGITHLSTGIAVTRDGKVLLVRREPNDFMGGSYELPGGGIDSGESFDQAVRREAMEETGLTVTTIVGMFEGFDYSTDKKPQVRQFNFMVEVADSNVRLSSEHDAYTWATEADIPSIEMSTKMQVCVTTALSAAH